MERRQIAVTGMGVVAPCGIGVKQFWDGLFEPVDDGVRRVEGFEPAEFFDNPKEARRTDRFSQFSMAAALMALEQAGDVANGHPESVGVTIGTGIGGLETTESNVLIMETKGPRRVSPFLVPMMMPNSAGAAVSMRFGFQGPCETTVTACAAGTHSIGSALRFIRSGACDAVIAGGTESALTITAIQGFINMTALSSGGRSMPFSADRDGFVIAEGAGVLVLEDMERALARGATVLAEVCGTGSTADAHHITAPAPGGSGAIRCLRAALSDSQLEPADIAQVNAHGTSTPLNDRAEAQAIAEVFGLPGPPVTSIKGVTGHSLGAAGALEAIASILSMQHRMIPPTVGTTTVDPELPAIDLVVGEGRTWEPGPVVSNSFGFGGHNGCAVFAPAPAV
jgi:3-oxoacyl-[acyl-carrier-protein] synthase II